MVNTLKKFFSSVRLTISVLFLLSVTSGIGTLIPQNAEPRAYQQAYGYTLSEFYQIIGMFDMYHSWWFQVLVAVLSVNIVVCSYNRFRATLRIIKSPDIAPDLKRRPENIPAITVNDVPSKVAKACETLIGRHFNKICTQNSDRGYQIRAEKGRWTRIGVYVVHLSVIVLLIGALIGSFLGFDGFVTIPEGSSASAINSRKSQREIPLGFEIRCNDFEVSFYDTGAPKEFRSNLSIIEGERVVLDQDIIVNDPLSYKGVRIYQSSYGQTAPETLELSFANRENGRTVRQNVTIGQKVILPDSEYSFTLLGYRNRYSIRGMEVGDTFLGALEKPGSDTESVVLPLRFPTFDKMRKGEWVISVADFERRYYTGLQVSKDPGIPLVYAGFILMLAGCYICFFMSHQRVCIEVTPSLRSSSIFIYGNSNRNDYQFRERLSLLSGQLAKIQLDTRNGGEARGLNG